MCAANEVARWLFIFFSDRKQKSYLIINGKIDDDQSFRTLWVNDSCVCLRDRMMCAYCVSFDWHTDWDS